MFKKLYLVMAVLAISTGYAAESSKKSNIRVLVIPTQYENFSLDNIYDMYKGNLICEDSCDWLVKQVKRPNSGVAFAGYSSVDETKKEMFLVLRRKSGNRMNDSQMLEELAAYGAVDKNCIKCKFFNASKPE